MSRLALILLPLLPAAALAADLSFEPNRGQTSTAVRYLARGAAGNLYFGDTGVVGGFELIGANPAAIWEPLEPTGRTTSYRIGRDRGRWVENVPGYRRLVEHQVYPGIDLHYYAAGNRLEYDFRLAPNADPSRIRLRFPSARSVSIAADGSLAVDQPQGLVRHEKPSLYETLPDGSRREVAGAFQLVDEKEAAFRIGNYDRARELSIDPVLDSSTFVGGSGDDSVIYCNGSITVGNTTSIDFPGAAFGRRHGTSVYVDLGNQTLVYGASDSVVATSAAAVSSGEIFVVVGGYTSARDLPTSNVDTIESSFYEVAAWQPEFAGGETDGFLLILYESSGQQQPSSYFTYLGTPRDDRVTAVTTAGSYFMVAGSTNGRGLPSSGAPVFLGVPAEGTSATDGFLITGYSELPLEEVLSSTTYFGGSGNTTPLAVLISTIDGDYVAGETDSSGFPVSGGFNPSPKGMDAFLMRFPSPYSATATYSAILYGGSGADRGTALGILSDGTILLAGTTSSPDLPLVNPAQRTYGGGVSDAFLAMFAPDLSSLKYATYLGGSGTDAATSITTDEETSIFVGGSTSSLDFPVQNAFQPIFGGGNEDGFVAHYDLSGNLQDSTYFGGSGRDQVLSLFTPGGSYVTVGGQTASANLPLANAGQSNLNGPTDGFVAELSSAVFSASPIVSGQDLRAYASFYLGNAATAASAMVTITSSDPTTVQVALNQGDPGQTSIQLPTAGYGYGLHGGQYYVDCLRSSGGANLTLSAAGYPSLAIPVTCYPAGVSVYFEYEDNLTSYDSALSPVTLPLGSTASIYLAPYVNTPAGLYEAYIEGVRPGGNPIVVQIANSNSSVGTLAQSSVTIEPLTSSYSSNNGTVTFTAAGTGETSLSFSSSSGVLTSNPLVVNVVNLTGVAASYVVPSGFQTGIYYDFAPSDPTQSLTVTSQDPGSLLVSGSASQAGSASIMLSGSSSTSNTGVMVQAIAAAGDVGVTFSAPGQAPVTTTVHITSPTIVFPYNVALPQPLALAVGQAFELTAAFGGADPKPSCCYSPNPGNNLSLTLTSSNSQAVSVTTSTTAANSYQTTFNLTAAAAGTSQLSIHASSPISPAANSGNFTAKVTNRPLILPNVEVGNSLEAYTSVTLPATPTSATSIQLTSSNPNLVLLSTNSQSAGQSQITVQVSTYSPTASFYVYGMAASGQAQITASVPGMAPVTATVTLDPSGFAWSESGFSIILYSFIQPLPSIYAYALDPTTLLPVQQQYLQPGITASIPLVNRNPNIVTLTSSTYTTTSAIPPEFTTVAAGPGSIMLVQPAGFTQPSLRGILGITVLTPTLNLGTIQLANNMQTSIGINSLGLSLPSGANLPLTITSSDPSRVLISSSATALGSASVTVNQSNWGTLVAQGLADNGTVTITASAPTFNSASIQVTLVPTGIGLNVNTSGGYPPAGTTSQNGAYYSTTQSPATNITPVIYALYPNVAPQTAYGSLRAGLSAVQVNVTSSNTAVATISGNPVTLVAGQYAQQPSVTFTPKATGQTNITVSQPAGFDVVPGASTLAFNVTNPTFTTQNLVMPRDTFVSTGVNLSSNVTAPTVNVTVTIASGDGTRVLLSPDATTPPAASITQTLIAGHTSASFYVHALSNSGTVPINISAPGYAPATMNIQLTDLTFVIGTAGVQGVSSPIQSTLQNGAQSLFVYPNLVSPTPFPTGYVYYPSTIRPGASITVGVTTSDATTVSLNTPQVVFTGGASQTPVTYVPQKPGTATLTLDVPSGYVSSSTGGTVTISVVAAPLSLSIYGPIGRDLEVGATVSASANIKPSSVTVTSSDPTRLLISADGLTPGAASANVTFGTNGTALVYLQALGSSGTVTVTVSASGYQSATATVTLEPSAAVFSNVSSNSQFNIESNAQLQQPVVILTPLNPVSLQPGSSQLPRPGANLAVTVTSSNPSALAVDTQTLTFPVTNPANPPNYTVSLQPLAPGTAIVSLGEYPTAGTPAYGSELVYNLAQPNLLLPGFALGQDLESSIQLSLAPSAPTPTTNLSISVFSGPPILLSTTAGGSTSYVVSVNIPAGQRVSQPLYVEANGTGVANISYNGASYGYSTSGTAVQTAFIFQQASPISMSSGSAGSFTVIPALSPPVAAALSPLSIRTGISPVSIAVTSSNPAVLSVATPRVFLNPGDQQATVNVTAVAPGQATLTLSGLTYDFTQAASSITVTVH